MRFGFILTVALSLAALLLPMLLAEADAKMLPLPNQDHTRGQITTMLLMPAGLTAALALMLGLARKN